MNNKNKNKESIFWSFCEQFFRSFFIISLSFALFFIIGLGSTLWWLQKSLPDMKSFSTQTRNPSITVQAIDGTVIAKYGDLYEEFIPTHELPRHVLNAFIAVEDKRFYNHIGFDIIGITRAFFKNFSANKVVQGGSTLTQQLAKNLLISNGMYKYNDRSLKRKLQEVILAIKLESYFSKNQIAALYLNRVYFGGGTFGIDAAARNYFDKSARNLTLFEAAVLSGLLCAPSKNSPFSNPKRSIERAKVVLQSMESLGILGKMWRKHLPQWEETFLNTSRSFGNGSRYFADWVRDSINSIIGPVDRDLIVVTTLNPRMQRIIENVCNQYYEKNKEEYKFSQMSAIAMTSNGEVVAMLGGIDYRKSQFNRATSALRQPGSAFKTFVYLAALEAGKSHDELVDDSAYEQGSWKPGNYKWKELGEISLFEAYVYSVNSVCIRIAKEVGIRNIIKVAKRLGITSPLNNDLTLAIGTPDLTFIELVGAYGPFTNGGYAVWPYGIHEIRDKEGNILYQHNEEKKIRVIEEKHLNIMKSMMKTVITRGTGTAAKVDPNLFGKTGSNSNRDAWFFVCREPLENYDCNEIEEKNDDAEEVRSKVDSEEGEAEEENEQKLEFDETSPKWLINKKGLVFAVWVGNDNANQIMASISTGGRLPARITGQVIKECLKEPDIIGEQNSASTSNQSKVLDTDLDINSEKSEDLSSKKQMKDSSIPFEKTDSISNSAQVPSNSLDEFFQIKQ